MAQLITSQPVDIAVGSMNFNKNVVKQNKIKNITLVIADKPDGDLIIDKGATQNFEFDTLGRVTKYYYTILNSVQQQEIDVPAIVRRGRVLRPATTRTINKYLNDTIFATIFYDSLNRLIGKRTKSDDYYDAYYYEYNEAGKIKSELHCKETNVSENKNEFKLGVQSILSTETFQYETLTPTQIKKKCLNDEGREYKSAIINYDSAGNKISENYNFIVSWMFEQINYEYNNRGNTIKRTYSSNSNGNQKEENVFEFDTDGTILSEKKHKNSELLNETSYLFDEKKLIKSHINRDFKNASIGIVKYVYTFY